MTSYGGDPSPFAAPGGCQQKQNKISGVSAPEKQKPVIESELQARNFIRGEIES
jgi:hypothetical protein